MIDSKFIKTYNTIVEWHDEAKRLFGNNPSDWKFICPSCGHVASVKDWKDAGAEDAAIAVSCVGRYLPQKKEAFEKKGGPCNYAGYGLIRLNPVNVAGTEAFDFAPSPEVSTSV